LTAQANRSWATAPMCILQVIPSFILLITLDITVYLLLAIFLHKQLMQSSRSRDWLRRHGSEPIICDFLVISYLLNSVTPPSWMISEIPLAPGWWIGNFKIKPRPHGWYPKTRRKHDN
jgi:hypothetical protein